MASRQVRLAPCRSSLINLLSAGPPLVKGGSGHFWANAWEFVVRSGFRHDGTRGRRYRQAHRGPTHGRRWYQTLIGSAAPPVAHRFPATEDKGKSRHVRCVQSSSTLIRDRI